MKTNTLILIILTVCGIAQGQVENAQLSFRYFDSVLRSNSSVLIDMGFPESVNKTNRTVSGVRDLRSGIGNFKLYSYATANKILRREKIVFDTNDDRNFQFFYLNRDGYYLGTGYYAYGKKIDDAADDRAPYIPSRLDAYAIFNDINNKYIVVYDKEDVTDIVPKMSSGVRIFLLDKYCLPKKILFFSIEKGAYLYQFNDRKFFKLKNDVDFYNTRFEYLFDTGNYEVDSLSKLRVTKGVPFFNWYMK